MSSANAFVPRRLANGTPCCTAEHALCETCQAHHAARRRQALTPTDLGSYTAGVTALRAAQGIVDLELTPDLDPAYNIKTGHPADPYAIAVAIRQLNDSGEPSPAVLSAAERKSLGGYAEGIAAMRTLNR
jgi:hypothetical protein